MYFYAILNTFLLIFLNPICSGGFYADNGREQTMLHKTFRDKEKIQLQEEILNLLELTHRPKKGLFNKHQTFDRRSSAERYLLDLYKTFEEQEEQLNIKRNDARSLLSDSDCIMSFANKIHHQYPHLHHESHQRFYFDVSEIPIDKELVKAELRIFRNGTRKELNKKYKYFLYLYAVSGDGYKTNTSELVDELTVLGTHSGGWLVFNVTLPVMKWTVFPKKNLGLYLKIKSVAEYQDKEHKVEPYKIGIVSSRGSDEFNAFMVAYFKTPDHLKKRITRATKKKLQIYNDRKFLSVYNLHKGRGTSKSRKCERRTLYVSFRDLGFEDWIIAPDGYAAYYCDGSCAFHLNAYSNASNHAVLQALMHLKDPRSVSQPSCAPNKLSAITVLYLDDNSDVILKKYKNMVVKSCSCQ